MLGLSRQAERLSYQKVTPMAPGGDLRAFNASLGTIPDYAGPKSGKGVLLADVRRGGAAELGGLRRGDVLVALGQHSIENVEALMYALNALSPGERVVAVVLRDGQRVELPVTLQEAGRKH
jgi:S1-C subfamily serine protease